MNEPTIGVMVLNRNGQQWLPPLFESLRAQEYPRLIVYLVDNASTDDSVRITQSSYPYVRVLHFTENVGYCMAYNRTMPLAFADGCEWVVWANSDVLLEPNCLQELVKVACQGTGIGVIGPAFHAWGSDEPNYYMKGNCARAIEVMRQGNTAVLDVDWVEGSFLMVSEACVRSVGGLDPYLFFYWEEVDFCRRARRKGWKVVMALRSFARHYGGGSTCVDQATSNALNERKSRNQYVYVLTDPDRVFAANLCSMVRLFLVLFKAAVRTSRQRVRFELTVLLKVLGELREIKKKWRRDRDGLLPADMSPDYANVQLEVLPGAGASVPAKA